MIEQVNITPRVIRARISGDPETKTLVTIGGNGHVKAMVVGVQGPRGRDGYIGADGADGVDGDSAYEIAVANGFVGTEEQWLASLKGEPGADADKNYTHTQISASTAWTIEHNLAKYPSVTVIDSGGSEVIGEVNYVDVNNLVITFTAAFGGRAYLN